MNNTPPKHIVKNDALDDVLSLFRMLSEDRRFDVVVEPIDDETSAVSAVPFKTETQADSDGELWIATITTDCSDEELVGQVFLGEYIKNVKKTADVKESVVLLSSRIKAGTKFTLHASAVLDGGLPDRKPTGRMKAALRGFKAQLLKWLGDSDSRLAAEADEILQIAIDGATM